MSVWIKICGLTTADAVDAAAMAQADAIGFVFAPSRRQVTPQRARELAAAAPRSIRRVAVMLHPSQAWLDEVCDVFAPDVLQMDAVDFEQLRTPQTIERLPVVRNAATANALRVLYEGAASGAGALADWRTAAQLARTTQLVLAGGLHADNVAAAIEQVRPFGVDVSSGVESAPGVKDPEKIAEFVRRARAGVM